VLLDTHALLWWLHDAASLSDRARLAVSAADQVFFSPVSIYEIEWKAARGRLGAYPKPTNLLALEAGFAELPVRVEHAHQAARMQGANQDPWDRLLTAQAMLEQMAIVTRDPLIAQFGVQTVW